MDINEQKQQFSVALVRAVAAVCGLAYATPDTDDDSIDATIALRGGGGTVRSPKLDVQLKCSSVVDSSGDEMSYPLPIKNYNELRAVDVMVPRILVVVLVPDGLMDWLQWTEQQFTLRKCAYWLSLRGKPETENTSSVTVRLLRLQPFHSHALTDIFDRLKEHNLP